MKQTLQTGFVLGMIFLSAATLGQTSGLESKKLSDGKKTAKTYLDLMVNIVSSNLNYGDANSTLAEYKKSEHGIQAGASFQAGITPSLSLVTELYFMKKGGTLKSNNPVYENESTLRTNSIELPVMARVHVGRFYMNAGPFLAYNLNGYKKIDGKSTKVIFDNSEEGFKRFEAGIQMGGGYEFPLKQRRISLDLRYSYGLTSVAYDNDIYNRVIMISMHISKPWKTNPLARGNN
jgi:hypothetical protein